MKTSNKFAMWKSGKGATLVLQYNDIGKFYFQNQLNLMFFLAKYFHNLKLSS